MPDSLNVNTTPLLITASDTIEAYISNGGPGTIYYGSSSAVSSTVYSGTISRGQSLRTSSPKWIVATTITKVFVNTDPGLGKTSSDELAVIKEAPLNVQYPEYGALGDGVNDDSSGIQAALDACTSGGEVFVPRGTYLLGTTLHLPDSTTIKGEGGASVLSASGNRYAIQMGISTNPTFVTRCKVTDLKFKSPAAQSSGGGIDFSYAGRGILVSDVHFGANLHTSLDMRPTDVTGIWQLRDLHWGEESGRTYGMRIGDGTNLLTDVTISGIIASGYSSTETWCEVKNNVDTLRLNDATFFKGNKGIIIGANASGSVTGMKMTNVLVDYMADTSTPGIYIVKSRGSVLTSCDVQTCGYTGMEIGPYALGTVVSGGVIQNNYKDGIIVRVGSTYTDISHVMVSDNNTSNGAFGDGISVSANTQYFSITNCQIGNNVLLTTGHQKYGVQIPAGSSDYYMVRDNIFYGNASGTVLDGPAAAHSSVGGNLG